MAMRYNWDEADMLTNWSEDCQGAPWWIGPHATGRMAEYARDMVADSALTPDMAQLSGLNEQLVFVYGTLKRGYGANELLGEAAKFVGRGWTVLEKFKMFVGDFPVVIRDDSSEAKAIQGEVFLVQVPEMKHIDRYEGNGSLFKRIRMAVTMDDNKTKVCWMYLGMPGVFSAMRTLAPTFKRKKTQVNYYSYTHKG